MGKRDDLIATYAAELKETCGVAADMELLTKVVVGLGPSVFTRDGSLVAASDKAELERIKKNYLIGKLGLTDGPELDAGIEKTIETYGRANRTKHRAVVYYLLAMHFGKAGAYA
jgi:hypothetical protein